MNYRNSIQCVRASLVAASCTAVVAVLGSLAVRAATYPETILADHPTAYYRLEESPGGITAVDSSATAAFPGTYTSADGVYPTLGLPGIDQNSAYFKTYKDDAGTVQFSYVEIPFAAELNPQGPFSAEAWVRPASVPTDGTYRSPVGNFGGWDAGAPGWFFYQTPEAAGNPSVWVWVMKGGGIWVQSSRPIVKNQWDYLAAVYDGSAVTFYLNGQTVGSSAVADYAASTTTSTYIGSGPVGQWMFDGRVDEVAIYGSTLTAEQIANHYQVGQASFRVEESAPVITQSPAAATGYAGRTAKFAVSADGTAPLSYQWFKGNTALEGATNDTLVVEAVMADNGAIFKAVVTNQLGAATSAGAALTVSTDLLVSSNPASITRTAGGAAAFRAATGGALPISFQWYKGAAAITGATNETLWLTNLQTADDATTYYVRVSNPWNAKDSEPATLTVASRNTTVTMTGYAKLVAADGPVGYWRLNETAGAEVATDAVGSFDGSFDTAREGSAVNFGTVTGIPRETDAAISVSAGARVVIPYALEMNPHGPFTAEAWVKPASLGANPDDYRTVFSSEGAGPTGWLLYQQPNHTFAWVIFNDNWVSSWLYDVDDVVTADTWYHIVLTRQGDDFAFYVNGQLRATKTWDAFIPNRDGNANFGWRSDNDFKGFEGAIDEVAFYNKALRADQILSHYQASVSINLTRSGSAIVLSWPFGILQEASAVTGTYQDVSGKSPLPIEASEATKFYRVKLP